MSTVIPREQAAAFERWELVSFDAKSRRPAASTPPPAIPPSPELPARTPETPPAEKLDIPPESLEIPVNLPTAEEIEKIYNDAKAEGYATGYEDGKNAGLAEIQAAAKIQIERLGAITDTLAESLDQLDQEIAEDVLGFAVEVARQLVSSSLQVRKDALLSIIREAMSALPLHHGAISIHINPEDGNLVRQHFGEQIQHSGWRIIEDQDIQAGGSYLRAGSSEVDATLHTRWRRALEAIGAHPEWLEPGPE